MTDTNTHGSQPKEVSQESSVEEKPETMEVQPEAELGSQEDASESLQSSEEVLQQASEEEETKVAESAPKEGISSPEEVMAFVDFQKVVDVQADSGEKLHLILEYMERALAQKGSPRFRDFWDARKLCIPLFKENINPLERGRLWQRYSELSREARMLKDVLDEQSKFAVEQIDAAIAGVENEVKLFSEGEEAFPELDLKEKFPSLEGELSRYFPLQRELLLLNAHASRVNSLRKELTKTEMRVRQKNKFYQRLSSVGDHIFPRRKELIKEVSVLFLEDVKRFASKYFKEEGTQKKPPLFALREQIKALQGLAKELTLNTQVFNESRTLLSRCWDSLREEDKERKKEFAKKRVVFKENQAEIEKKFEEFSLAQNEEGEQWTSAEALKRLDAISQEMRSVELGREEVKSLRDELQKLKAPWFEKQKLEAEEKRKEEEKRQQARKVLHEELQEKVEHLLGNTVEMTVEQIELEREALEKAIDDSDLLKPAKQGLRRKLRPLATLLEEKKEQALLSLSADDQELLGNLRSVLKQRKQRRQVVREQMENARKEKGASGFDFEKAMENEQLLNQKRQELQHMDEAIREVEVQIQDLKDRAN